MEGRAEQAGGESESFGNVLGAGLPAVGRGGGDDSERVDRRFARRQVREAFVNELFSDDNRQEAGNILTNVAQITDMIASQQSALDEKMALFGRQAAVGALRPSRWVGVRGRVDRHQQP